MRTREALFNEYGESHQHPTNKTIHWICVPLIFWAITAMLWSVKFEVYSVSLNASYVVFLPVVLYYFWLSFKTGLGMILFITGCLALDYFLEKTLFLYDIILWKEALAIFVLAWMGQFIGHKIEGKKPSFLKDLVFLLIGPAWLMHLFFKKPELKP